MGRQKDEPLFGAFHNVMTLCCTPCKRLKNKNRSCVFSGQLNSRQLRRKQQIIVTLKSNRFT